ncbi:dihydrodipicolinate synthase family protein [Peribacillus glennii]|nr:dihydrodipicolinate synthase family protein [Peribacillus glennii]
MTNQKEIQHEGVFSLMLTPFKQNLEIDWKTYDEYVDWQLAAKPHGLFAVCGSSEMKWLTLEERLMLSQQTVNRAGGTPVLATANVQHDILEHKEEVRRMIDTGVSGIVLVPPEGLGEEQDRLMDYFAQLANVADIPVFLYEWPQTNPYFISPEIWGKLTNEFGIKGIKDTTCTFEGIKAKIIETNGNSLVYQANTPFMLDAIAADAKGIMAITSAAFNELVVEFWKEASKDHSSLHAKKLHQYLVFLDSVLRFGYPATAKYLAKLQGISMETFCRWPVELNPEAKKAVDVFYEVYKQWQDAEQGSIFR